MKKLYVCPTCGNVKPITKPYHMSITLFEETLPKHIFCGHNGCQDNCLPDYGRSDI